MIAVIMAGGRGTRIASVSSELPKPMLPIAGLPVLEHEIESLKSQGITELIFTVSHKAEKIQEYFGDGEKFGVHISYFYEEKPLGNAGALYELKGRLTEDFLLLNGDVMFEVDFERMMRFHKEHGQPATILTHPNDHPYDSGLIVADEEGRVEKWLTKEDDRPLYYKNRVNAGLQILSPMALEHRPDKEKVDLDRDILRPLAGTGKLVCYDSTEYVKDMGTPERYAQVEKDFVSGKIALRSRKNAQKAIFFDRDGTLNRYVGFLRSPEELELLPGAAEAVRKINESDCLAVVVTNQPVIARGEVTEKELSEIHNKMETLLGKNGAYIDGLYVCPHHPDKGFEGERPELKIDCDCRKPKPGLFYRAAEDLHIDLASSWMIGDDRRDVEAGKAAGCHTAHITEHTQDASDGADLYGSTLLELINQILN